MSKLLNQFRPMTVIARTTPGTHNPRISVQTVSNRLQEIGERPPYTCMFLFWPSIYTYTQLNLDTTSTTKVQISLRTFTVQNMKAPKAHNLLPCHYIIIYPVIGKFLSSEFF